jgi:nicotinamidase-related amidase
VQNVQLMAKNEDFGFQSFERKQSHIYPSKSLKKVAISFDHDPILFSTANLADEVFGRHNNTTMAKRIVPDHCCGLIIDVQMFFLAQVDKRLRSNIMTNTKNFVRLLGHFRIPIIVTLERPVGRKGALPQEINKHLSGLSETFEKDFFDLCKENNIKGYLGRLKKQQVIVAGCETDVCVLQSCLGLLSLGYEVYVVEELLFSSSRNVDSAIARMKAEGAILLSYKSLYHELVESVKDGRHTEKSLETFNLPDDLPDSAVQWP